jgi:hypothetical protein
MTEGQLHADVVAEHALAQGRGKHSGCREQRS